MKWALRIMLALVVGAVAQTLVAWCFAIWGPEYSDTTRVAVFERAEGADWTPLVMQAGVPMGLDQMPEESQDGLFEVRFAETRIGRIASADGPFDPATAECWLYCRGIGATRALVRFYRGGHAVDGTGSTQHGHRDMSSVRSLRILRTGFPWTSLESTQDSDATFLAMLRQMMGRQGRGAPPPQLAPVPPAEWCASFAVPSWLHPSDSTPGSPRVLPLMPYWPGFAANSAFYGATLFVLLFGRGLLVRHSRRRRGACVACGYDVRGLDKCPECGSAAAKPKAES